LAAAVSSHGHAISADLVDFAGLTETFAEGAVTVNLRPGVVAHV
jgi:hypothetical protein